MGARRRSSNNGSIPPESAPQINFHPLGGICRTSPPSSRSVRRAVYAAAVAPRPCPAKPLPLALSLPLEPRYPEQPPTAPPRRIPCSPAQVRSASSLFPPEPHSGDGYERWICLFQWALNFPSFSNSSETGPVSTTAPSSRITTLSALRIVPRRWAITMIVLPCSRTSLPFCAPQP